MPCINTEIGQKFTQLEQLNTISWFQTAESVQLICLRWR